MHANIVKEEIITNTYYLLTKLFILVDILFPIKEILEAIDIILDNNIFVFSDKF